MAVRYPQLDRQHLLAVGVLLCEAAGSALRFAVNTEEPMRTTLVACLKQLIVMQLEALLAGQTEQE
ncbi:hypothetical protein GCM10022278_04470 [Allohahella marinimesophila]|uniref:Uncharacterized protein n=1 Tax=Allohahella marinimesophila TaxID=1054972 RepID=A0ABP7NJ77_9GAMM